MNKIPLVKPYLAPKNELMPALEEIIYSGYIAQGEAVEKFEKEMNSFLGVEYGLSLNSGTSAIQLALKLLDIGVGDEVISTPMTAEPTNTAIKHSGASIVFADVDQNDGNISLDSIKAKVTPNTKAVLIVHYAGYLCKIDEIVGFCKSKNIHVVEDAAHALGAEYNNRHIGQDCSFTIFSFQAIKHMTTVDGGYITLSNKEDYERAKKLRWFGLDKTKPRDENRISEAGFKYHMNNVNATIGLVQLKHIKEIISKHRRNGRLYDERLKGLKFIELCEIEEKSNPSYWLYTLKVKNGLRDSLITALSKDRIIASPLHTRNDVHPAFCDGPQKDLISLDKFELEYLHIPCGWWISETDVAFIVEKIKTWDANVQTC